MKLCVICKHCNFEEGYCYSEMTYADSSITCYKHPKHEASFSSQEDFFTWNAHANICPHYEPANSNTAS